MPKVSPTHEQLTELTIMTNAIWVLGFQEDDSGPCERGQTFRRVRIQHLAMCPGLPCVFSLCRFNKALLCPILLYFRKKKYSLFLQGSQASPICLSSKGNVQTKGVRSNGAIMLTGINQSTRKKTSLSATVYTTNFKWTVLSSNTGLRVERPETNLSHDTVDKA